MIRKNFVYLCFSLFRLRLHLLHTNYFTMIVLLPFCVCVRCFAFQLSYEYNFVSADITRKKKVRQDVIITIRDIKMLMVTTSVDD